MSEPTREEMLKAIKEMEHEWLSTYHETMIGDERRKICKAIRALIEQSKPKKTKEINSVEL